MSVDASVDVVLTRGRCTPALRAEVRAMVRSSGLASNLRPDLAHLILWHLGKADDKPWRHCDPNPARQYAFDLLPRRAWELVEEHRRRLPPVHADREGPAWE